jgi:hypothetical protein
MMELANTRLTIMRGTTVNAYGDESDVGSPIATGIPAAVTESSKQVWDPATQQPRTVRTSKCVVPGWVDVVNSDTLLDETTGNAFMIQDIQLQPTGPTGIPPAKILTLRGRSGVSVRSERG